MFVPRQIFNLAVSSMSLVSASKIVGGIREYTYRGLQQLPIVIASTSFLLTIATGSMAHANLTVGMAALMPLYTLVMQKFWAVTMNFIWKDSIFWKRVSSDTCKIIPDMKKTVTFDYYKTGELDGAVPSYWFMAIAYFIGYSISNAVDSLQTPAAVGSNEINHEKRNSHAIVVIVTTVLFAFLVLVSRFYFMSGCEGVSYKGMILSVISAIGAAAIGNGMYTLSKQCGARSSDLFGILSQILPPSSTSQRPVVCTAS